jgi:inorganic pyrophosphatase
MCAPHESEVRLDPSQTAQRGYDLLPPFDHESGLVNAIVDTPYGSRCKYKYEPATQLFRVGKLLPLGAAFPFNFGFIPSTVGEDGDAIDILILLNEPLAVGTIAKVHLVGVLQAEQTGWDKKTIRNDRLLGSIETKYNRPDFASLAEVGSQRLDEIEHFFTSYNVQERREVRWIGRAGAEHARRLIEAAQAALVARHERSTGTNQTHSASQPA